MQREPEHFKSFKIRSQLLIHVHNFQTSFFIIAFVSWQYVYDKNGTGNYIIRKYLLSNSII
jgi:hypothetical protein